MKLCKKDTLKPKNNEIIVIWNSWVKKNYSKPLFSEWLSSLSGKTKIKFCNKDNTFCSINVNNLKNSKLINKFSKMYFNVIR